MPAQSKFKDEAVIARVVLVPKSHWKALGEHAKLTTGKTDRSTIIRKLIRSFVQQTGALRKLKAQAAKAKRARDERAAAAKPARKRKLTKGKRRAA